MAPFLICFSLGKIRGFLKNNWLRLHTPFFRGLNMFINQGFIIRMSRFRMFSLELISLISYVTLGRVQTGSSTSEISARQSIITLRNRYKLSPHLCTGLLKLLTLIFNIKLATRLICGWLGVLSTHWPTLHILLLILMQSGSLEESIGSPNTPNRPNTKFHKKLKI